MRHKLLVGASALILGLTIVSAAGAADLGQPVAAAPVDPNIVGYFDVHGGGTIDSLSFYDPSLIGSDSSSGWTAGGAGRGVVDISSSLSTQLDVSLDFDAGNGDEDSSIHGGIGDHLTFHPTDADVIGLMGSIGSDDGDGIDGTAAIEAAHNGENWRLYGQAGVAHGLAGYAGEYGYNDLYAVLSADYFVEPNLMLSAYLGASQRTANIVVAGTQNTLHWGAEAEYKPDGSPVSFYLAYKGNASTLFYPSVPGPHIDTTDHRFLIGLRLPFGTDSVQTLQNKVGLRDMNPVYGDLSSF